MNLLPKNKRKRGFAIIGLFAILALVLLILPADYFDEGQSICVSVLLFDVKCYGCGMTRAVQHLIHLDFAAAAEYNKLVFIVFPLLVFMIMKEVYERFFSDKTPPSNTIDS